MVHAASCGIDKCNLVHDNRLTAIARAITLTSVDTSKQLAIRLSAEMLEQIDRYAEHMREQSPGLGATRTDAVRVLLAQALANLGKKQRPTVKVKRK